jgi:dienelactone hydrolase
MHETARRVLRAIRVAALPAVLVVLAGCSSASDPQPSAAAAEAIDPSKPGPFPVGNLCLHLTDSSRYDASYQSDRQLLVEVWYPAAPEAAGQPEGKIMDFVDDRWAEVVNFVFGLLLPEEELENLQKPTGSVPLAPPDREHGPYPVILFSHGNGGLRFQNYTLARHLASHGFVFVAPDHTENCAFAALPDQLVIFNPLLMPKSFLDRPADLAFILDDLLQRNAAGSGDFLEGLLDPDQVALSGHSLGGTTVMLLVQLDSRVKSGITLAGPWIAPAVVSLEIPMMYMIGLEDKTVGVPYNSWIKKVYEKSPLPKFLLEFPDGGHYTFTDACGLAPTLFGTGDGCGEGERYEDGSAFTYIDYEQAQFIQHAYITAFLEFALKQDAGYAPWLGSNHFPEAMQLSEEVTPVQGR